jgi:hypothetical protein
MANPIDDLQPDLLTAIKATHKQMLPVVATHLTQQAHPSVNPATTAAYPTWERNCLVSVGATTTFTPLVETVFSESFIGVLVAQKYTRMTVQCGRDAERFTKAAAKFVHPALQILVVDLVDDLSKLMIELRGDQQKRRMTGVLICHAGKAVLWPV